ncbi:putative ketohexokinase [Aspergillus taichungensis]|uniref:Putative ketohexokinase n=1 Tax=Aspergillus taichungensis TaxID=482145 RepID=A0A2J5HND1_9EURO|nr:putative ketohexokinase [Aspergillus taichungensis]
MDTVKKEVSTHSEIPALIGVGACYIDTILTAPHYPGEDEKLRASSITRRRGGNCPNSIEVLHQLIQHCPSKTDLQLGLVSVLPTKSSAGVQQVQSSLPPGVDLSHCIYREQFSEPASSYIIKSEASGSRTIVNYNELPEMEIDEFSSIADRLGQYSRLFHFEGRIPDVTVECIRYLRQQFPNVIVSVEVEKPQRPGLEMLAAVADIVFYSKSWALGNGYKSAEECLHGQAAVTPKATSLYCTWGQEGAWGLDKRAGQTFHGSAYTPPGFQVVDTIGAGDTFIGGILYTHISNKDFSLLESLQFANRLAGLKVAQEGFSGLERVFKT